MATRQEMLKIRAECLEILKTQSLSNQTASELAQQVIQFLTKTYGAPAADTDTESRVLEKMAV